MYGLRLRTGRVERGVGLTTAINNQNLSPNIALPTWHVPTRYCLRDSNRKIGVTLTGNINDIKAPFDYTWLIEILPGRDKFSCVRPLWFPYSC